MTEAERIARPRYVIMIGASAPRAISRDQQSQDALWRLIFKHTGLDRQIAGALLDRGRMLFGGPLIVAREDFLP